jgi:single-strand DNA-binding protein
MGRLTKDIEMRQTPNGVSLVRFSIAVTRRFKNSNGEYDADFINCVAWRKTGEFIARYFQKGSMIAIVGSIQTRSWDGNDGKKQYATEVIVDEAYFTGSKSESGTGGNTDLSDSGLDDLNSQYGEDFATIGEEDLPF